MDTGSNIWNDLLQSASKDEMKRETNLVILGESKSVCLSVVDGLMESLGQSTIKKRDIDIINYSYVTIGYPNRRNNNGDYLGVINIYILTNDNNRDILDSTLSFTALKNTMYVIATDFRDTPAIISDVNKWVSLISERIDNLIANEKAILQSSWKDRVVSLVQTFRKSIPMSDGDTPSEEALAVLPSGLLDINLGVPILVIGSHTEVMSQSTFFTEITLDFIQKNIRSLCLQYGASMLYINTLKRTNYPLALAHILSCLFSAQYSTPLPNFLSKDETFIPVGCDNVYLIHDLVAGTKLESVTDYNAVIERHIQPSKKINVVSTQVLSEEAFFTSLMEGETNDMSMPRKSRKNITPSTNDSIMKPRMSIQPSSPQSTATSPRLSVPVSSEMNTRSFFENLMNGSGASQSPVPRKSVNVRNLRRSEAVVKK